jgi:soluble lytic murein transglycosylase-like protein
MATEWTITVTIRPFWLIRKLALAVAMTACVSLPRQLSERSVPVPARARVGPQVSPLRIESDRIEEFLAERMELDGAHRKELAKVVVTESRAAGLDPLFVLAIIEVESGFDWEAVSPAGAQGLMQIVPGTWADEVRRSGLGRVEMLNPVHNVTVGVRYLRRLARSFPAMEEVLLAYNRGPGAAARLLAEGGGLKRGLSGYSGKVLRLYRRLLAAQGYDARMAQRLWRGPRPENRS